MRATCLDELALIPGRSDFSRHVEKPTLNLTPQLLTKAPASLQGLRGQFKASLLQGERFSTSRENLALVSGTHEAPGAIAY